MSRAALSETKAKPKPTNNIYTALLAVSLVAMVAASALLFYDLQRYPTPNPPTSGTQR